MTVIFDLDHTLLDTVRFKKALGPFLTGAPSYGDEEIMVRAEHVFARMEEFLFPDARRILETLKEDGYALLLLTYGHIEWQRRKVERSGLDRYFENVIYTTENKEDQTDALRALRAPVIMVNDNGREIDAFRERFPGIHAIAVRGPKSLPRDTGVLICRTLEDVYAHIRTITENERR